MTKRDLLKRLEGLPDDAAMIIVGEDGGWTNISGKVEFNGSTISLLMDSSRPCSSDN